jgi:hypothetical protein
MVHTLFAPLHPGQLPTASDYGDAIEFLAGPKSLHITGINMPLDQVTLLHMCSLSFRFWAVLTWLKRVLQGWAAGAFAMPG